MPGARTHLNALKVSERMGTWVLYAVRDARDLEHLLGYMTYTVDDIAQERDRARSADKKARNGQLIGIWRRAIRFVSELDRERYGAIAERLIEQIEAHPAHRKIPYYVRDSGHRTMTIADRPPRRAGRPRTRPQVGQNMTDCIQCRGVGFVAA